MKLLVTLTKIRLYLRKNRFMVGIGGPKYSLMSMILLKLVDNCWRGWQIHKVKVRGKVNTLPVWYVRLAQLSSDIFTMVRGTSYS